MKNKMKKGLCALFSFLMVLALFSGCGTFKNAIVLVDIANKNTTKALMEAYDSILVTYSDETGDRYGYYVDDELGYYYSEAYTDTDGNSVDSYFEITTKNYQEGVEGDASYSTVYAGGEIDTSWFEHLFFLDSAIMMSETVEETVENGDLVTYRTKITVKELIDLGYAYDADMVGCYYITEYTVNAETLHLQSMTENYYSEDGTLVSSHSCAAEYNAARPEKAEELVKAHDAASFCTVTVVKDMDSGKESFETFDVPKGNVLYFYWYGDYANVYLDRACTSEFTTLVIEENISLYLK